MPDINPFLNEQSEITEEIKRFHDPIENSMSEFETIDFQSNYWALPEDIQSVIADKPKLINNCFLHSLNLKNDIYEFEAEPIKYLYSCCYSLKKDNLQRIIETIKVFDNAENKNFTKWLERVIGEDEVNSVDSIWKEIMACGIIYSLRHDYKEWAMNIYYQDKSAFSALKKLFGEKPE